MQTKEENTIAKAARQLEAALLHYDRAKRESRELAYLTVAKAFEVLVEYAWKELKHRVQEEGLDAPSPKEAVRQAYRIGLIDQPKKWIACIDARNDSVHNYFNVPDKDYVRFAREFSRLSQSVAGKAKD